MGYAARANKKRPVAASWGEMNVSNLTMWTNWTTLRQTIAILSHMGLLKP